MLMRCIESKIQCVLDTQGFAELPEPLLSTEPSLTLGAQEPMHLRCTAHLLRLRVRQVSGQSHCPK